jgi:hypothetical protein
VVIIDEATQALEAVRWHILTMAGMTLTHVAGLLDTHIQGKKAHPRGRPKATSSDDPFITPGRFEEL